MKAVSLFSGCGGMDLGFVWAGYKIIWANDIDHDACETYKLNIGDHIIEGDISQIDLSIIPDCDVILGGFPCQDFSMIWKRKGIETDRGNLYQYFVQAVELKQPKFFVAENVKGLLTANKGKAIEQIIKDFKNCGYNIYPDVYNFADYGTPQLRERVLIIGIREDISFYYQKPKATHTPSNYVTTEEALKGVKDVFHNNKHLNIRPRTKKILELIPEGCNFQAIPKDSPYYVKGMISHVYRRLDRNKPATTIIAAGGGGTWGYHYEEPRPLTNRERARLFGYPDDFQFKGKIASVRKQIGNSVCPNAIKVIAQELKKVFDKQYHSLKNPILEYLQLELPIVRNIFQFDREEEIMQHSSRIHTISSQFKQEYKLVTKISTEDEKNNNLLTDNEDNIYLTKAQTLKFLKMCGRSIQEKDLDFRKKENTKIGLETIKPEIQFQKVKGSGNRLFCSLRYLENYTLSLYKRSMSLDYHDAKTVVEYYDSVLIKPKKYGMRGQRNFTGKIEDEVRGKLAEHGFGKYAVITNNIEFPVDYSLVEASNAKRDTGDFNTIIIDDRKYDLKEGFRISLKSTNGNYLAIPQHELQWEGEIFVLVKLHIKETFLYKAIKAGLQLSTLNLNDSLGWLEIRGVISKKDFKKGYLGEQLPDKTPLRHPNYIKAPIQLEQDPKQIFNILENIKQSVIIS
jgi:DNA (cytosine-5)-methyltransferase 1